MGSKTSACPSRLTWALWATSRTSWNFSDTVRSSLGGSWKHQRPKGHCLSNSAHPEHLSLNDWFSHHGLRDFRHDAPLNPPTPESSASWEDTGRYQCKLTTQGIDTRIQTVSGCQVKPLCSRAENEEKILTFDWRRTRREKLMTWQWDNSRRDGGERETGTLGWSSLSRQHTCKPEEHTQRPQISWQPEERAQEHRKYIYRWIY